MTELQMRGILFLSDTIVAVADRQNFRAVATSITLAKDKDQYAQFVDEITEAGFIKLTLVMAIDALFRRGCLAIEPGKICLSQVDKYQ